MKKPRIAQCLECIETYKSLVDGDMKTVRKSNRAVSKLRSMITEIWNERDAQEVAALTALLDSPDPQVQSWIAFQTLDVAIPDDATEAKCIEIITKISHGDEWSVHASGARYWLKDWPEKRARIREEADGQ